MPPSNSRTLLIACSLSLAVILTDMTVAMASGYRGMVFEKRADGSVGYGISGVHITFADTNGRIRGSASTDPNGRYRIDLRTGGYRVAATHPDYEAYSSAPGFFVVTGQGYQIGNIFLKRSVAATVILIRHAERDTAPPQDPPLSPLGATRANELIHVAQKAGVKAIFATSFLRSRQTVQPLSTHLNVPITNYTATDYQGLKSTILSAHPGEVVLVAGHSDTIGHIIQILGGNAQDCTLEGDEYDNLCLVTIFGSGRASVLNLQYGAASP